MRTSVGEFRHHLQGNHYLKNMRKLRDPLPEEFVSEEEAGEFWDAHSTADYEEYLEPVDMTIDIQKRQYLIEVDQETFAALFQYSLQTDRSVKNIASNILKERLVSLT